MQKKMMPGSALSGSNNSPSSKKNIQKKGDRLSSGASNVRSEIDVRGMTVEEAIVIIERQLNDSAFSGLETFRIIHGKGTGALRRGIQSYLKEQKAVKEFRDGVFGEGDLGVTVVKLK